MDSKGLVLVTGGSGYVGSVLVPELLKSGYRVRVIDAGYFGHGGLDSVRDKIELYTEDIRTCSPDLFKNVDAVIHLAGFSNDPTAEYNPIQNFSANFDGTRRVTDLAKSAGARRMIFASSCSVYYTNKPDDTINTEETPVFPKAPYSLSKHLAEQYVLSQKSDIFAPISIRKSTLFGQSPRMRYDLAIDTFIKNAYINKSLILHAGGWMWRPFLHVRDAARAYTFLLEEPREAVSGQIFNAIGFNKPIKDIAEDIRRIIGGTYGIELTIKSEKTGPQRSYRVSGEKLAALGFVPEVNFADAVKETWDVLISGKQDLGESKYYNIRQFEYLFPREF